MSGLLSIKRENENLKCNIRIFRRLVFASTVIQRIRILILVISGFLIFNLPAHSQSRGPDRTLFETNIGYGYPESICFKVKIGSEIQAGLSQSFDTHGFGPTGLEIYYRFGYRPRLMDQKPWYGMAGFAGYIFDVDYVKEYKLLFYPRAGRSLYFSNKIGLNFDIGLGFPMGRNSAGGNAISPLLPSGSMGLFFRF